MIYLSCICLDFSMQQLIIHCGENRVTLFVIRNEKGAEEDIKGKNAFVP